MLVKVIRDVMMPIVDYYDVPNTLTKEEIEEKVKDESIDEYFFERDIFRYIDCMDYIGGVEIEIEELGISASENQIEKSLFEQISDRLRGYGVSEEIIRQSVFI